MKIKHVSASAYECAGVIKVNASFVVEGLTLERENGLVKESSRKRLQKAIAAFIEANCDDLCS
jgi:hypothetical protein